MTGRGLVCACTPGERVPRASVPTTLPPQPVPGAPQAPAHTVPAWCRARGAGRVVPGTKLVFSAQRRAEAPAVVMTVWPLEASDLKPQRVSVAFNDQTRLLGVTCL